MEPQRPPVTTTRGRRRNSRSRILFVRPRRADENDTARDRERRTLNGVMMMALLRTEFLTFCAWGDCVCVNVCLSGLVLVRVLRYSSQDAGVVGAVIVIAVVDITDVA